MPSCASISTSRPSRTSWPWRSRSERPDARSWADALTLGAEELFFWMGRVQGYSKGSQVPPLNHNSVHLCVFTSTLHHIIKHLVIVFFPSLFFFPALYLFFSIYHHMHHAPKLLLLWALTVCLCNYVNCLCLPAFFLSFLFRERKMTSQLHPPTKKNER